MPFNVTRRDALRILAGGAAAFACSPHLAWADTQSDLDAAQAQADQVQSQLDEIASQAQALATQAEATADQIEDINNQISDTESDIDKKQSELKEKQDRLAKRVSAAYKGGNADMLSVLLSSTSFDELTSNIYYLDKISESDKAMIDDVKNAKAELDQKKADLESQKADLEQQKEQQQSQLADMQANQAKVQETLDGLNDQVSQLVAQRNAEIAEQARQAELQKQAQAAAAAAAQQQSGGSSGGSSSGGSSSGGSSSGGSSSAASGKGAAIVAACSRVGSPGAGLCAMWVSQVYSAAGCGYPGGNANDMYWNYCTSSDRSQLQPGMIIAVPSHPHTVAGRIYGHVGIYIGGNTVMHNIGSISTQSLDSWISFYGATYTPRWGWA